MKKRKKYATGTAVTNYMQNPYVELQQDKINKAKALSEAENNPLWKGMDLAGNLAMGYGISQGGFGDSAMGELGNSVLPMLGNMEFANGGQVPNIPVEVEGNEVGELPGGDLINFKGAAHEQGGINVSLPEGTEIYSDRIKVKGKTMANRKQDRQKRADKLMKKLTSNPTDALTKNAAKRTETTNKIQDAKDKQIQQVIDYITNLPAPTQQQGAGLPPQVMANGTTVGSIQGDPIIDLLKQMKGIIGRAPSPALPSLNQNVTLGSPKPFEAPIGNNTPGLEFDFSDPQFTESLPGADPMNADAFSNLTNTGIGSSTATGKQNKMTNPFKGLEFNDPSTYGDKVGLAGDLVSTFAPYLNTLQNRADDTPNINPYLDYGTKGLQTLEQTKGMNEQLRDSQLSDLQLSKASQMRRGRNSARGVNTQRALDLAATQGADQSAGKINDAFTQQLMQIFSQQAGMENQQDKVRMGGEGARDLADRQDNDNFYTQLGLAKGNIGTGLQETGKDMNAVKQNQVIQTLLGQLSKYGITVDAEGNLTTNK